MENKIVLTKEGKAKLSLELANLINHERPAVIEDIKIARAQGDLSENAEFDAARERQGQIEDRISEIENILDSAKIIVSTSSKTHVVRLGSKVEIEDLRTKKKQIFQIVGTLEADPFHGLLSNQTPLAKAILNKTKNDVVSVDAHQKYEVKIISIKN